MSRRIFILLIAAMLAVPLVIASEGTEAYRAQGLLQYKLFTPPKLDPVTATDWQNFHETSYFDLTVSNCRFHMVVVKEWQDPGILYYEVGSDGTNVYQQTVFSSKIDTERVAVPRSDGTWKEIQRARAKPSLNDSAGQIHPGPWPKDRGFHESIIWFALASQCLIPREVTVTNAHLPMLWEYGDNYIGSFTSRFEVLIKSLATPPFLPEMAAYLAQEPSRTFDFPKYTNVFYAVSGTMKLAGLELPREFTLSYGEEMGHSSRGDRGVFHAITLFKGTVTNASVIPSLPQFVPLLSSRALVTDHRFYYREKGERLVPVTSMVSNWHDIANLKTNLTLLDAFPQAFLAPGSVTPPAISSSNVVLWIGGGALFMCFVAAVWLRKNSNAKREG